MTPPDAHMQETLDRLGQAIDEVRKAPGDTDRQREVCLLSRSAYTGFYAESTIEEHLDPATADKLRRMLRDAVEVLSVPLPNGEDDRRKFQASVESRLQEFEHFCESFGTFVDWLDEDGSLVGTAETAPNGVG